MRPSPVILRRLSSSGGTPPSRTRSALSDSSSISSFCRSVMGTGTGTCSSSGRGSWMSSLVIMSVNCFTAFISSGRFWNRANLCLTWKPLPSGFSSTVGTTWP